MKFISFVALLLMITTTYAKDGGVVSINGERYPYTIDFDINDPMGPRVETNLWRASFRETIEANEDHLSSGLFSTIKFGIKIKNYKKDVDVHDLLNIKKNTVQIENQVFEVETASKIYNPDFPTVVGHFGFSGDVLEGNAKYFAINFHENFPNYNLLLIQTMASANFSANNCYYSIGGLDEADSIVQLVSSFVNENKLNKKVHFIGGSSSSAGLFHSASYFNRETDIKVKGLFLQSGFNHMGDIVEVLKSLNYSKRTRKRNNLRRLKLKEKVLAKALLGKRIKSFEVSDKCAGKFGSEAKEIHDYYNMMKISFSTVKSDLENLYTKFYPNSSKSFETMEEYYTGISLAEHTEKLNFNMFWLHSLDDPMSKSKNVKAGQKVLLENPKFASMFLEDGGHSAYKEVYGEEFLNTLIKTFLASKETNI